jgi:hypothetical protein
LTIAPEAGPSAPVSRHLLLTGRTDAGFSRVS